MTSLVVKQWKLLEENFDLKALRKEQDSMILMASIQVQSDLIQQIKEGQLRDPHLIYLRNEVEKELKPQFQVSKDGLLRFGERVCVTPLKISMIFKIFFFSSQLTQDPNTHLRSLRKHSNQKFRFYNLPIHIPVQFINIAHITRKFIPSEPDSSK